MSYRLETPIIKRKWEKKKEIMPPLYILQKIFLTLLFLIFYAKHKKAAKLSGIPNQT